jgi:hypothetical protein
MFDLRIPNDLKAVDVAIRDYYGMEIPTISSKEEKNKGGE